MSIQSIIDPSIAPLCIEAVEDVLSAMFFDGLAEPVRVAHAMPPQALLARVSFHGTFSGAVHLAVASGTAQALTRNFLGWPDERPVDREAAGPVVKELANICCGSLLSRIEPEGRFDIDAPELCADGSAQRDWLEFPLASGAVLLAAEVKS
jgi:CheY-specific phosphatase CheX